MRVFVELFCRPVQVFVELFCRPAGVRLQRFRWRSAPVPGVWAIFVVAD